MDFYFVALTLTNKIVDNNIISITWEEIIELLENSNNVSQDFVYSKEVIQGAIDRAKKELSSDGKKVTYQLYKFDQLMNNLEELISKGKVYVGFNGGIEALNQVGYETLENRSHYKVSETKWTENWITIDNIVRRYVESKYLK